MKRKKYIPLLLLPVLLLLAVTYLFFHMDTIQFRRLSTSFFTESLENDALTLHYTLADPDHYGIAIHEATLPVYSRSLSSYSADSLNSALQRLDSIDPEKLSDADSYTYKLLSSYLNTELDGTAFSYYEEPLSPSSGMHTELPLLLAEYTFRSRRDVDNYLSLLASIPAYLDGLSVYESEKAEAGLFMPKQDALAVAQQCNDILSQELLSREQHFLQSTFSDRLSTLLDAGEITGSEQKEYLAENHRLLTAIVWPAYQKLGDALVTLSEKSIAPGGLCTLPEGKEYYAWLIRHTTGCQIDPDALFSLLQKQFQKTYRHLQTLVADYQTLTGSAPDFSPLTKDFSLSDPDSILTDLQKKMEADFPALDQLTDQQILCTIKDVDTALESFTSPAYYMTPPVDDLAHNTICINRSSTAEGLELYTTLAHEGYPGHLYQTVYSGYANAKEQSVPIRELLFFGGYTEGWAYYTERLSYVYAAQLMTKHTSDTASLLCEIAAVQRDLQINLFCLSDIALHYRAMPKAEILQALEAFGIIGDSGERVYNYLRTSPAVYLKYYVGYLEMLALREKARSLWGDAFTLLRFHTFILEAGPSDFSTLINQLNATAGSDKDPKVAFSRCRGQLSAIRSLFFHHTFHISSVPQQNL